MVKTKKKLNSLQKHVRICSIVDSAIDKFRKEIPRIEQLLDNGCVNQNLVLEIMVYVESQLDKELSKYIDKNSVLTQIIDSIFPGLSVSQKAILEKQIEFILENKQLKKRWRARIYSFFRSLVL
jgi:predicted thioredoxin/glutaredoxin